MAWWQWLVGILLFIVALGVLIGIHELGHLGAAKLFNVYCFNYSIGFGPVIVSSKRTDKRETIWTLRAIPLGGFVSMYGEGVEVEDGLYIPPSRSLEGVARYKRAVIVSAGVICNFVLGFVLILMSNVCFDHAYFTYLKTTPGNENLISICMEVSQETTKTTGINNESAFVYTSDPITGLCVANSDITIKFDKEEVKYVLTFSQAVSKTTSNPSLSDMFMLYPAMDINTAVEKAAPNDPTKQEQLKESYAKRELKYAVDASNGYFKPTTEGTTVNISLGVVKRLDGGQYENTVTPVEFTLVAKDNKWQDIGLAIKVYKRWYSAGESFKTSWNEWCTANSAVFRGLASLFTNINNVSGIIGIAKISSATLTNFGFGQYLYLWGMISCNLAIINLLPFPGLDGWSLVVTAYEGVRKKQIPTKAKSIISFIGLSLLFVLMIMIVIKDIITLI